VVVCTSCRLNDIDEVADTRSHPDCSGCSQKDSTGPPPTAFRASCAPIGDLVRSRWLQLRRSMDDQTRSRSGVDSRGSGGVSRRPGRRILASLGVAGARGAPDPASVYRPGDSVFGRPSRDRHCRNGRHLCPGGRRRAFLRLRRRPERAVDRAFRRSALELRARALIAVRWRSGVAGRGYWNSRTRALCRTVPAFRRAH
jgi:hypothetical protein